MSPPLLSKIARKGSVVVLKDVLMFVLHSMSIKEGLGKMSTWNMSRMINAEMIHPKHTHI